MTAKKILHQITETVKHPLKHPVKAVAGLGVLYLFGEYLVAPKGRSLVAKAADAVMPSAHARPRLPPPGGPGAHPAAPPGGPAALAAQTAATKGYYAGGPFGPGWGRGNMNYQYGSHWQETPADISAAHRAWAAAAGQYPDQWTQSSYPWG